MTTHRGLSFIKMEGLGNDFIVIDLRTVAAPDWLNDSAAIRRLCDRHRGIGADGVLAILPPRPGALAIARMRVLNADGSEAEMCGNGLRCVAKYLFEQSRATPTFDVETGAGILRCEIHLAPGSPRNTDGEMDIEIAMGPPQLLRGAIPMAGPPNKPCLYEPVMIDGEELRLNAVSMGNPHIVIFTTVSGADLVALAQRFGPQVEQHRLFPQRTNVELCYRRAADDYEVVVWERGCGITQACGTGACAVAVAACRLGLATPDHWLRIELPGGALQVRVLPGDQDVRLRGPARSVFSGQLA